MKFLIVDDSKAMQRIITKTLTGGPFEDAQYLYAFNGKEALEMIKEHKPDMVLTDWHMPEMSGLELLLNVQKSNPQLKVGVVTTDKSEERVEQAKKAGALFYVCKPFTPETVHAAIINAIESRLSETSDSKTSGSIYLPPPAEAIGNVILKLSGVQVSATRIENPELDYAHMPFLIGMYEDANNNTRAIVILDVAAVCLIGAVMEKIPADEAMLSIKHREIPEHALLSAKTLLTELGHLFCEKTAKTTLHFDVLHVVSKPVASFRTFLDKWSAKNHGVKIHIDGYGKGSLLIIQH